MQQAVAELQEERANIGAAWRWSVANRRYGWLLEAYEGLAHFAEVASVQTWVITLLREAVATLTQDDPETVHIAASFRAALALLTYRVEDAVPANLYARQAGDELLRLGLRPRNHGLWAAHYASGLTSMLLGEYGTSGFTDAAGVAARDLAELVAEGAERDELQLCEALLGIAHTGAAMNRLVTGDLAAAQNHLAQVQDYFERTRSPYFGFHCRVQHSACRLAGRLEDAAQWLQRGLELAKSQEYRAEEVNLELAAASLSFSSGDLQGARRQLSQVQAQLRRSNDGFIRAPLRTLEGWLHLAEKRSGAASESILAAIEYSALINSRLNLMEPLFGFAQIQAATAAAAPARIIVEYLASSRYLPAALRGTVTERLEQWEPAAANDVLPDRERSNDLADILSLVNDIAGREFHLGRAGVRLYL